MILVNTDYISGKNLEMLGLVKGSTIQSKNIGKDITQGFKTLVGGELTAYNDMMNEARALKTQIDKSGQLPPELIQELAALDDEALSRVLEENPDLIDMM